MKHGRRIPQRTEIAVYSASARRGVSCTQWHAPCLIRSESSLVRGAQVMTNARGTIAAEPEPIDLDWTTTALVIIDMQRDFMEPGGFGETLGNDVSQLARAVQPIAAVLAAARENGIPVIHTREGHLPDLSDAPPAKVERGKPSLRIGDPGPMGRIL